MVDIDSHQFEHRSSFFFFFYYYPKDKKEKETRKGNCNYNCLWIMVLVHEFDMLILFLRLQIKKFKDALAKHKTDQSSLGPPKGLEEKELIALSSNRDLDFKYSPKPVTVPEKEAIVAGEEGEPHEHSKPPLPLPSASKTVLDKENTKILVTAER